MEISEIEKGQEEYFIIYVDVKDAVIERSDEYLHYNVSENMFRIYFREPVYYVNDFDIIDMCISPPNYILLSEENTLTFTDKDGNVSEISVTGDNDGVLTLQALAEEIRSKSSINVIVEDNNLHLSSSGQFSLNVSSGLQEYVQNSEFHSDSTNREQSIQFSTQGTLTMTHIGSSSGNISLGSLEIDSTSTSNGTDSSGPIHIDSSSESSGTFSPSFIQLQTAESSNGTSNMTGSGKILGGNGIYKLSIKFNFDQTIHKIGNPVFHCTEIESGMPHPPLFKKMQGLYKYIWTHSNRYLSDIDHNKFKPIQKVLELNFNFETKYNWNLNNILFNHHPIVEFSLRLKYLTNSSLTFKSEIENITKTLRDTLLEGVDTVTK